MRTTGGSCDGAWPEIGVAGWAQTKRSLHLYAQMLGKIRLALSPAEPNWTFTALHVATRGITTGFIPYAGTSIEAMLDVFDSRITLVRSTGDTVAVELVPVRTVADVYTALQAALERIGVKCSISPVPQEVPDTTPFDEDQRRAEYDPAAALRWFRATTAVAAVFEKWRAHFFGRSGVHLWWGAFDIAVSLFNGEKAQPPKDRGYLMRYDLDAQLMNVGLYFGDETTAPFFYGYIYPEPSGAPNLSIQPQPAGWSPQLKEWVLPYEAVRMSREPQAMIGAFADSIYAQCFAAAGWDREALRYDAPKRFE